VSESARPRLTLEDVFEHFEIPPGNEHFLFMLPPFYVARADGDVSIPELFSAVWNNCMQQLTPTMGPEKTAAQAYLQKMAVAYATGRRTEDLRVLSAAINLVLRSLPDGRAQAVRESIQLTCTRVARASGPLFREKVSAEERQMLDEIFEALEK